jgi:hypothetical protein
MRLIYFENEYEKDPVSEVGFEPKRGSESIAQNPQEKLAAVTLLLIIRG